ncbi:MAG: hypothetical protein L0287_37090, partial [Anaerolineae bacterium]|nr:hypothetical protein [Anaerolineae bacterium]
MNINSFLLESALKQLDVPESALVQLRLATALSEVNGKGFPKDLFQLNIRMIVRGLLNFGTLQMNRDWVYPYWVHQQLDPKSKSYVARSQNPLLINITHRNWTALGSPTGKHEAVIDPRGLATPLPRDWSTDTWLQANGEMFFPSLASTCMQSFHAGAPSVTTVHEWRGLQLVLEAFTGSTKNGTDILFQQASVRNTSPIQRSITLFVAIRPFNPEGVAPIRSIEFRSPRQVYVNNVVGVVLSKEPNFTALSNAERGDISRLNSKTNGQVETHHAMNCEKGLAHAIAAYTITLAPNESWNVHSSIALATEAELKRHPVKHSWRVSYQSRKDKQQEVWKH